MTMQLGIFAKTFDRETIDENVDAVKQAGLDCVQYNLVCAGLSKLPRSLDPAVCSRIRESHASRGISMPAISATFNILDADQDRLEENLERLRVLAESADALGTRMMTLCTGSRDQENMWRHHPENDTASAWQDMMSSMRKILVIAEGAGVDVGVEPEINNVVSSAQKAHRMLEELASTRVKIVIDGANLITADNIESMSDVLLPSVELLRKNIAIAHAKDVRIEHGKVIHVAPGQGQLDYESYLEALVGGGFDGPLVMHGLTEAEVPESVDYVKTCLVKVTGSTSS